MAVLGVMGVGSSDSSCKSMGNTGGGSVQGLGGVHNALSKVSAVHGSIGAPERVEVTLASS